MSSEFLDAAAAIGRGIVADAIWDDGRCSWVGVSRIRRSRGSRVPRARGRTSTTARPASACSSRSSPPSPATRRSPDRRRRAAPRDRGAPRGAEGFHVGSLGIAWAAARAAALLGRGRAARGGRGLPAGAAPPEARPTWSSAAPARSLARLTLAELLDDAGARRATRSRRASSCSQAPRSRATAGRGRRPDGATPPPPLRALARRRGDRLGAARALRRDRRRALPRGRRGRVRLRALVAATRDRAPGRTCGSAASAATRRPLLADHRHLVPRRGRHRAHAAARDERCSAPSPYADEAEHRARDDGRELGRGLPYDIDDLTLCHGAAGAADVLLCAGAEERPSELGRIALDAPRSREPRLALRARRGHHSRAVPRPQRHRLVAPAPPRSGDPVAADHADAVDTGTRDRIGSSH